MNQPHFLHKVFRVLSPYLTSSERYRAFGLALLILTFVYGQVRVAIMIMDWHGLMINALVDRSLAGVWHLIPQYAVILVANCLLDGCAFFATGWLKIHWQRYLAHHYLDRYLSDKAYLKLQTEGTIDNPDQRLSQDIMEVVDKGVSFVVDIFRALLGLIAYGAVLWHLSGIVHWHGSPLGTVAIPGMIFWVAVGYALVGNWLIMKLFRRLSPLNYTAQRVRGDYRFALAGVREHCDDIARTDSARAQSAHLKGLFHQVVNNAKEIIQLQKYVFFFRDGYQSLSYVLGMFVALPRYFAGALTMGDINRVAGSFASLQYYLGFIIHHYESIARWQSVVDRLYELDVHTEAVAPSPV